MATKKVLMVLTSHDQLGATAEKTGFWLEEFAAPYYVFVDAGFDVTLASPKGGQPPVDPRSALPDFQTDATHRFDADEVAQDHLANTLPLGAVKASDYDAVFYPGGHGPLWDLVDDPYSIALIEDTLAAHKPLGAVCHGPVVLMHAKDGDGVPVVKGRKVTGFSNSEEVAVGLADVVPVAVESMLKEKGGKYEKVQDFTPFALLDGSLITGQNPQSSAATAELLVKALR